MWFGPENVTKEVLLLFISIPQVLKWFCSYKKNWFSRCVCVCVLCVRVGGGGGDGGVHPLYSCMVKVKIISIGQQIVANMV